MPIQLDFRQHWRAPFRGLMRGCPLSYYHLGPHNDDNNSIHHSRIARERRQGALQLVDESESSQKFIPSFRPFPFSLISLIPLACAVLLKQTFLYFSFIQTKITSSSVCEDEGKRGT